MTLEIVLEKLPELVLLVDVGAGRYKMTTGQDLVEVWVITTIKLVNRQFPDGVASAGAVS